MPDSTRYSELPMAPQRKLTKREFDRAVRNLQMTTPIIERCRAVLVDGARQIDVAEQAGVGAGTVCTAVNRVWRSYLDSLTNPEGYEEVTALLTDEQAAIVRTWHRENTERRKTT